MPKKTVRIDHDTHVVFDGRDIGIPVQFDVSMDHMGGPLQSTLKFIKPLEIPPPPMWGGVDLARGRDQTSVGYFDKDFRIGDYVNVHIGPLTPFSFEDMPMCRCIISPLKGKVMTTIEEKPKAKHRTLMIESGEDGGFIVIATGGHPIRDMQRVVYASHDIGKITDYIKANMTPPPAPRKRAKKSK